MDNTLTKEQIIAALVPLYNAAYDEYYRLTDLSIQLLNEDEDRAYRVIARKATQKCHFMDGVRAAAEALGITENEFTSAAACQHERGESECREK